MPKEYNLRKRKTPVQYNEEEVQQVTKRPRKQSTKSTPKKQKATITVNPNQENRSNHSNKPQRVEQQQKKSTKKQPRKKVTKTQSNHRGVILDVNISSPEEETTIQPNDLTETPQNKITEGHFNRQGVKLDFNNILPVENEKEARIQQSEQPPDKENEREEEVEEQIDDVLNALLELHHLDDPPRVDTYEGSNVAIAEALRLNREMQNEAIGQIAWIKQRILQNEALMRQCRMLSMRESMAQERRLEVHRKHDNKFQFFVDDKGETPPMTSSSSTRAGVHEDVELERRSWSKSERKRLLSGIHIEAQRALVFELVSRNDEHRIWEIDKLNNETLENIEVDKLDWNRISSLHVKSRTPMQCIIQWTTQEHPKINKRPWSKAESKLLMELVDIHGYQGQWEKIAVELDTNRTASQCFSHYQSEHNNINLKRKWTKEDDEALTQAVEILGERNWQQVAYIIGDRTGNQCLQRWSKSISPAIRRQRWTKEEDDALKGAVEAYGVGNWNKVQRYVPGRTDMQCRERYMNVLDPKLDTSVFTSEETVKLFELVEKHGRKWSYLTRYFPGRTDNHLFRAWKIANKKKEKLNKAKHGMLAAEPDTESIINEQEDDEEE